MHGFASQPLPQRAGNGGGDGALRLLKPGMRQLSRPCHALVVESFLKRSLSPVEPWLRQAVFGVAVRSRVRAVRPTEVCEA